MKSRLKRLDARAHSLGRSHREKIKRRRERETEAASRESVYCVVQSRRRGLDVNLTFPIYIAAMRMYEKPKGEHERKEERRERERILRKPELHLQAFTFALNAC